MPEKVEQGVSAFHIQGRGRLVKDQQSPRSRHCAGQRHELPAMQRQHAHRRVEFDRARAKRIERFACDAALLGMRPAPAECPITAEKDVVEHRQFRRDQSLLEDRDDPARLSLARRMHREKRPGKLDGARVGTHNAA